MVDGTFGTGTDPQRHRRSVSGTADTACSGQSGCDGDACGFVLLKGSG